MRSTYGDVGPRGARGARGDVCIYKLSQRKINMDGIWMEYGWNMDGIWMEYGWNMDGIWMEHGWNMDGLRPKSLRIYCSHRIEIWT